jgi:hypothetical protein
MASQLGVGAEERQSVHVEVLAEQDAHHHPARLVIGGDADGCLPPDSATMFVKAVLPVLLSTRVRVRFWPTSMRSWRLAGHRAAMPVLSTKLCCTGLLQRHRHRGLCGVVASQASVTKEERNNRGTSS